MKSSLGQKLRAARLNARVPMKDAIKKLGISQSYLSNLETNKRKNPSIDLLYAMADLYKVPLEYFTYDHLTDIDQKIDVNDDKEKKIAKITDLLRKVNDSNFDKVYTIVKTLLSEFIE